MRKILLFLLVFGAGAAALWWFEERRQERIGAEGAGPAGPAEEAGGATDAGRQAQDPDAAQADVAGEVGDEDPGGGGQVEVVLEGEFDATYLDEVTGLKRYSINAQELKRVPGTRATYDAQRIEFRMFEPGAGADEAVLTLDLEAQRGRLRIDSEPSVRLADGGRVELFGATVVQLLGGALAPLTFTATELLLFTEEGRIESVGDTPAEIRGVGLDASGRGLTFHGGQGRFAFRGGGRVELAEPAQGEDDEERGRVVLENTGDSGQLEIRRPGGLQDPQVEVDASGGARLQVEGLGPGRDGAPRSQVSADRLVLRGVVRPTPEGDEVLINGGEAEGRVFATHGADKARGGQGRLGFVEGDLAQVVLDDGPSLELLVQEADAELGLPEAFVFADGAGPLELDLSRPRTHFKLDGPGRLQTDDRLTAIDFARKLSGHYEEQEERGAFHAEGSVLVVEGERRLETDVIDIFVLGTRQDEEGEARLELDLATPGAVKLEGPDAEGVATRLIASRGANFELRAGGWRVPSAETVDYGHLTPDGSFRRFPHLTAGRVLGLDWAARKFEADGGVEVREERGVASGLRAVSRGPKDFWVFGTEKELALFLLAKDEDRGSVRGERVTLLGETISAEGKAHVKLIGADRDASIKGRFAQLSLLPPLTPEDFPEGAQLDPDQLPRPFALTAQDVTRAMIKGEGSQTSLSCLRLRVDGLAVLSEGSPERQEEEAGPAPRLSGARPTRVVAEGAVRVNHRGRALLTGVGDRFTLDSRDPREGDRARLEGVENPRVTAWGRLDQGELPYELTGRWVETTGAVFEAQEPTLVLGAVLLPIAPRDPISISATGTQVHADHLRVDRTGATWTGNVRLEGRDRSGYAMTLDTQRLKFGGKLSALDSRTPWQRVFEWLDASGGFEMNYASGGWARGEHLYITQTRALFEGFPAQVKVADTSVESNTIEVDLETFLVTSERGIIRATGLAGEWSLEYASMTPVAHGDETMVIIGQPRHKAAGDTAASAEWAVLWVHGKSWRERAQQQLSSNREKDAGIENVPQPRLPERDLLPNIFRGLPDKSVSRFLRAVYLEGEVESIEAGRRAARAGAFYLDLVQGQGWVRDADFSFRIAVGGKLQSIRASTSELKTAADGTLIAEKANITACDHADPHYVVETGDLVLEPRERGGWRLSARSNVLRMQSGFQMPLPPLGNAVLDPKGNFKGFETETGEIYSVDSLTFGSSARFGTLLATGVQSDVGAIGKKVGSTLSGKKSEEIDGRWKLDGSYLGSRGFLVDVGLQLREKNSQKPRAEQFWLDTWGAWARDDGEDRGIIKVDPDERSENRTWIRARGRYPLGEKEWIDIAFTTQSDPGVQSEFFQRRYLAWEERDSYLHWRKAVGADYYNVDAKVRIDDYRTEVERLPALGAYRGVREIGKLGKIPLLFGASIDLEYLRRRQGDPEYEATFPDFPEDRETLRVDSKHTIELPFELGLWGVRATPFVEGRATAWEHGVIEEDQPVRGGLFGGVELSTTLSRVGDTSIHTITPSIRYKEELAYEEHDGTPVQYDLVDRDIEGDRLDIGLRSRHFRPGTPDGVDLELRGVRVVDRPGSDDDWNVFALAEYRDTWGGWPVALVHDGHIDLELERTLYSRSRFAFSPDEDYVFEVGYDRAIDENQDRLFENTSLRARMTLNPKWEVEGSVRQSVRSNETLNNTYILRRFSHDYLIEIEVHHQAGEGTDIGIGLKPLFGWKPKRWGMIRRGDR